LFLLNALSERIAGGVLPKVLNFFDMVVMVVAIILWIPNAAVMTGAGAAAFIYWGLAVILKKACLYYYKARLLQCSFRSKGNLMLETGAASLPALSLCFALAPSLGTLIVPATTGLRENTRLLHFAVKLFQCYIKWAIWVYNDLGHRYYQRDLLVLARRLSRG
jgi:hypothetical protein